MRIIWCLEKWEEKLAVKSMEERGTLLCQANVKSSEHEQRPEIVYISTQHYIHTGTLPPAKHQ